MGTIWIKEFTGGLDTRRLPETTPGGVLITAQDGHITRGGEFEQRAAFIREFDLPAGTLGLAARPTGLVVFGSGSPPAMPAGVTYQRLQHPNPDIPLTRVLSWDLYAGKLFVAAEFANGSRQYFYDGALVTEGIDGRARAAFRVTGGSVGASLQTLTVNGVDILGGPVNWTGSNEATAVAIAAAVNAFVSDPDYVATGVDGDVNVIAATPGANANARVVAATGAGGLTVFPATGLVLAGGADGVSTPGTFVKTIGAKIYATSGPNMSFSGIKTPTGWTTDTVGAGFIDMSTETSGSETLQALAKYQSTVAVFSERVIQIWYVDPDPALNKQTQVLNNTGTASPHSVTQFGDNDIFYLNESGLRSLRARDSSNAAATTDIGIPVDTLIVEALRGLTDLERSQIFGLIEPREGRFWLTIKDKVFVFSYFPGSKVSAWSTYSPGFDIEEALPFARRVYLRSGNAIYCYGGTGDVEEYDDTPAVARLPYLDAGSPTMKKTLMGVDAALRGEWLVSMSMQPDDLDAVDLIATLTETTFCAGTIPARGSSTHFGLTLTSQGVGPHRLGSLVIHFEGGENAN